MIGFRDPEPPEKEIVVESSCTECPFFVVEYNGGNHAAFCSLDDGPIIAEVFEDYKSDSVHEDCPLRKKHYLVRLKGFPPKEDWVP
jgi:hypothetical protein